MAFLLRSGKVAEVRETLTSLVRTAEKSEECSFTSLVGSGSERQLAGLELVISFWVIESSMGMKLEKEEVHVELGENRSK